MTQLLCILLLFCYLNVMSTKLFYDNCHYNTGQLFGFLKRDRLF